MSNLEEKLVLIPDRSLPGNTTFEGVPCPSKKAYELLGDQGIDFIHKSIQTMLECRKKMFGVAQKEFYGFKNALHFINTETRDIFSASERIFHDSEDFFYEFDKERFNKVFSDTEFEFPERLNFDKFYLIEWQRKYQNSDRDMKNYIEGLYFS